MMSVVVWYEVAEYSVRNDANKIENICCMWVIRLSLISRTQQDTRKSEVVYHVDIIMTVLLKNLFTVHILI